MRVRVSYQGPGGQYLRRVRGRWTPDQITRTEQQAEAAGGTWADVMRHVVAWYLDIGIKRQPPHCRSKEPSAVTVVRMRERDQVIRDFFTTSEQALFIKQTAERHQVSEAELMRQAVTAYFHRSVNVRIGPIDQTIASELIRAGVVEMAPGASSHSGSARGAESGAKHQQRRQFVEHSGFSSLSHIPLRLSGEEWHAILDTGYGNDNVFCHPRFTMWSTVVFAGEWDYCEVIEVALPGRRYRKFGPHLTRGLAREKALAYLVLSGAVQVVGRSGSPGG